MNLVVAKEAKMTKSEKKKMEEREQQWEAEEDLRTLKRASEIRDDPKRLRRAQAEARRQVKAAQKAVKDSKE
jgi:hypothetical protein